MSLILDALRKMEQERQSSAMGGAEIRPKVTSYTGRPHKRRNNRYLAAAGSVVLLLAVGVGLFMLISGKSTKETGMVAAPPSSPATTKQDVLPSPLPPKPALKGTSPLPAARASQKPATREQAKPRRQEVTATAAEAQGLSISGIAWQDERRLRRAVVNGELVSEGTEIAGARVVEIKENRIRFSRNGRTFDLPYASAFSR